MLQIGIVGCGGIAQVHARVLTSLPEVRLAACADIRPERAEKMGAQYGCRAYASMEDMLEGEKLDAVHLCTPHYLHTPMALECARRGLAVFMEKPPAISQAQWAQLAALDGAVPVGVCFQNRFNPNYADAKALIGTEEIGALKGARAFVTWDRDAAYYLDSGWRGAWATEGGGALINQAIHTLDQLLEVMGRPDGVYCTMAQHRHGGVIEVEDTVEARLIFGQNTALFYATTAYAADAPVLLEFLCEKAVLRLEDGELEIRYNDGRRERRAYPQVETLGKGYWGNGHLPCIQAFYDHVRTGKPYPNTLKSAENTVQVMLEMYRQGRG